MSSTIIHASTSFLRHPSQFHSLVSRVQGLCKDRILAFALSHNTPDHEQSIQRLSACTKETIGCISAPTQEAGVQGAPFSCSVAIFDAEDCRPFGTLKSGEGPLQVGRWHSFRKKDDVLSNAILDSGGQIDWEDVWNRKSNSIPLPIELLDIIDSQAYLYFSDSSALDFAMTLHQHSPHASQLGISASSTPFVTGLPFTLLRNGRPQSSGAVGIALRKRPMKETITYNGLIRLTKPLPVRRAEGNLIHALGESLPARILLKAIEEHGLPNDQAKDADYYVGLRGAMEKEAIPLKMHRIIAGDPSRGSIAVEDVAAPPVGSLVEFYYMPKNAISSPHPGIFQTPSVDSSASRVLFSAFINSTMSKEDTPPESASGIDELEKSSKDSSTAIQDDHQNTFLVSTENGFIYGGKGDYSAQAPWKCSVPGTFGGFYF